MFNLGYTHSHIVFLAQLTLCRKLLTMFDALPTFATEETSRATFRMPAVELPLKTSSVDTPSRLQRLLGR